MAGCTDVGLWVTKQHRRFPAVIDVTRAEELRRIDRAADGALRIGAAATLPSDRLSIPDGGATTSICATGSKLTFAVRPTTGSSSSPSRSELLRSPGLSSTAPTCRPVCRPRPTGLPTAAPQTLLPPA